MIFTLLFIALPRRQSFQTVFYLVVARFGTVTEGNVAVCILVYRFAPIPWNKITPRFNLVPFFYSFTYSPTPYQLLVLNTAMQTFSTP